MQKGNIINDKRLIYSGSILNQILFNLLRHTSRNRIIPQRDKLKGVKRGERPIKMIILKLSVLQ